MGLEFTGIDDAKRRDIEAFVNRLRHQLDEA